MDQTSVENDDKFSNRNNVWYSSLRPKRCQAIIRDTLAASKSILLASFEQQQQFDPTGTLPNNFAFEISREKALEEYEAKKNRKSAEPVKEVEKINVEIPVDDSSCDSSDVGTKTEIILNIEAFQFYEVYKDILSALLHLREDDDDLASNKESALNYVRDAFGVSANKHNEILEDAKKPNSQQTEIGDSLAGRAFCACVGKRRDSFSNNYVFVQHEIENYEAVEAHICLLKILLKYELEGSHTPHFFWSGKFNYLAASIIKLHSKLKTLSELESVFSQLIAFIVIHHQHPLDLQVLISALDSVIEPFKDEVARESIIRISTRAILQSFRGSKRIPNVDEAQPKFDQLKTKNDFIVSMFWNASKKLLESFSKFNGQLYEAKDNDEENAIEILREMFVIINKIKNVEPTSDPDLHFKFEESFKEGIETGVSKYLRRLIQKRNLKSKNNEIRLTELIKVMEVSNFDYIRLSKQFELIFSEQLSFSYAEHLFKAFDRQLVEIMKAKVIEISSDKYSHIRTSSQPELYDVAAKLFQLYMAFKSFYDRGLELFGEVDLHMKDYFDWFVGDAWHEASEFKALTRIEKAIDLDNLQPLDKDSLKSSSAVDTLTILYSVRNFFDEVKNKNAKNAKEVTQKICGNICRFATIYFDILADRAVKCEVITDNDENFKVPLEVFVAICDINFITKGVQTLTEELLMGRTTDNTRIKDMVSHCLLHAKSRIKKLIQMSVSKMKQTIRQLMLEETKNSSEESKKNNIGEKLNIYIEDSLDAFNKHLIKCDFQIAEECFLRSTLDVFSELIDKSSKSLDTLCFFSNLRKILDSQLTYNLYDETLKSEVDKIDEKLEKYELNTTRLIHHYYKECYRMQQDVKKTDNNYGDLRIKCSFKDNSLILEILNAKGLVPILGTTRKCNSFVKINIFPEDLYPEFQRHKTKVTDATSETFCPLYDSEFEFNLTPEQQSLNDAIIVFTVKDELRFGTSIFLAETFLSFSDIVKLSEGENVKQISLNLSRNESIEMESLKALKLRRQSGDKAAKEFLAKTKRKLRNIPVTKRTLNLLN